MEIYLPLTLKRARCYGVGDIVYHRMKVIPNNELRVANHRVLFWDILTRMN